MLFNSFDFILFFPLVLLVHYAIPARFRYLWLLAASYYFYMCWNAKYALLLFSSTLITYLSGLLMEQAKQTVSDEKRRTRLKKAVVALSFVINIGILVYYKYFNFSLHLLSSVLNRVHIQLNVPQFDIILPVGISFYTFQALSYTMDVYRDEIYAEKNLFRYALFVSFFPQLVAGPIERSKSLLTQLAVPKPFEFERAREGFLLMLWGYFLKIVLADRIAIFVDAVYGDYGSYPGFYLVVATLLFAVQIYCDFAGYSTIAIGSAKILGIQLMENFDAPYLSTSVSEFWRRWHISLTSWFKDYLYIPLGGNRKGKLRKNLNKMIVFLVSGLWHGASISFVVWGGLNGLFQVLGEVLAPLWSRVKSALRVREDSAGHRLFQMACTFVLVDFSWVFFRADSMKESLKILRSIFTSDNAWILFDGSLFECGLDEKNFILALVCIGVLALADCMKRRGIQIRKVICRQDAWFRCVFIAVCIVLILLFGKYGPVFDQANFIYFQF